MQTVQTHSQILEVDGQEYQVVHDDFEIEGDLEETEEYVEFDVVLAREMVQPYRKNGDTIKVLKDAEELKKAAEYADTVHITDGHPSTGVVKRQTQKYGTVRDISYDSEMKAITGRARVVKEWADDQFVQEILDEERTDVSIGFYAQYDRTTGDLDGETYDAVQRNIVLDHLAIAPPGKDGRCSSEDGCGIVENMADTIQDQIDEYDVAVNEPEDPEDIADDLRDAGYEVELRACNCGDHKGHITILGEDEENLDVKSYFGLDEEFELEDVLEAMKDLVEDEDLDQDQKRMLDEELTDLLQEEFDLEEADTIFDWEQVEDGSEPAIRDRYLNQDGEFAVKEDTIGDQNMSNDDHIEDVTDLDMDDLRGHPEVRDLEDQVQSLEDQIENLEDAVEVGDDEDLESKVQDLKEAKEQLDSIREDQVADLREELQEDYGLDEEKVEDKELDELETMKDTLEEADVGQEGEVTSTQTGTDTGSDKNLISPQSGPHADSYEDEE